MMDCRSFRDNSKTGSNTLWGEAQKNWLKSYLQQTDKLTYVLNGVQFKSHSQFHDGMDNKNPDEFRWLMQTLSELGDKKIILVSGDVHYSHVQKITYEQKTFIELTSSCLHSLKVGDFANQKGRNGQLFYCGELNFLTVSHANDLNGKTPVDVECISNKPEKGFRTRLLV
jgi:phosphodiesterase/alkaline phosphatase D-like protein